MGCCPIKTLQHAVEDSGASRSAAELGQAWASLGASGAHIDSNYPERVDRYVAAASMQPSADARFEVICISIKKKPSRRGSYWA